MSASSGSQGITGLQVMAEIGELTYERSVACRRSMDGALHPSLRNLMRTEAFRSQVLMVPYAVALLKGMTVEFSGSLVVS
jgi:hypothetical protein